MSLGWIVKQHENDHYVINELIAIQNIVKSNKVKTSFWWNVGGGKFPRWKLQSLVIGGSSILVIILFFLFLFLWLVQHCTITADTHHLFPSFSLPTSCEGARLPALGSQSSRPLAVECWEYPERKGKWHHSGDLPYQPRLPVGGQELPNKCLLMCV